MARWYKLVTPGQTFDATGDPFALNVEMDITVGPQHGAVSGSFCRVWGIPLQTILTANQFNNQQIQVYGGMQQGLPLSNPAQQGLLVQGTIFPCVGNWVNTDMTLDFYLAPPTGGSAVPTAANVTHNWMQGTPLQQAIQQTLSKAFPGLTPNINISPNLKLNYTDRGFYQNIQQYAQYIFNISKSVMGANNPNYLGVQMSVQGNKINVSDGTQGQQSGPTINPTDLVGQPIWTGPKTIQFKTVMRGDISLFQTVTLPKSLATLTAAAGTQLPGGSGASNIIQGSVTIQQMRHVGNFRQPDWASWVSVFDGIVNAGGSVGASTTSTPLGQGGIGHQ
jgi:hypothetical protein